MHPLFGKNSMLKIPGSRDAGRIYLSVSSLRKSKVVFAAGFENPSFETIFPKK